MKRWSVVCDFPAQPADESADESADQRAGQSASSYDDLEVGGEENLDACCAAGALALGVGLSAKPRRKQGSKTVRRRLFGG